MKDFRKYARKIIELESFDDVHNCGCPTEHCPVNLYFRFVKNTNCRMYVCYDFGKWSIDYTVNRSINMRTDFLHIRGIKTDREMLEKVKEVIELFKEESEFKTCI